VAKATDPRKTLFFIISQFFPDCKKKVKGTIYKIVPLILVILPYLQHRSLPQKLLADDLADGFCLHHAVALIHGDPFDIVGFAGQQNDIRKGGGAL
jgi:hypothetical protein